MKPAVPSYPTVHPLPQPFRFLYRVWYCLIFIPTSFLLTTPLFGSLAYLFSFLSVSLGNHMGILWGKSILWTSFMRTRVLGSDMVDPKQSYVIVANHESHLDIVGIYGYLPIDFRWVMKMEIRKYPIMGPACERLQHVYVDRSNREKAIASLERAKSQLTDGRSILFFPEGTRSNAPEMLPFKKGAFRMAIDLQLPILPVTLRNTGALLPVGDVVARPGTLEIMIHEPIPVDNLTTDDLETLMQQVRDTIQTGRKEA